MTSNEKEMSEMTEGNSMLSLDLYKALRSTSSSKSQNMIYSPLSLSACIAMIKLGAKGDTSKEIEHGMHFPSSDAALCSTFQRILSSLAEGSSAGVSIKAAHRVYLHQDVKLNEKYAKALETPFSAQATQINFEQKEASAKEINGWVEKMTKGKIKQLISPSSLNSDVRMILINGIYFKGLWKYPFDPKDTKQEPFYLNENDTVSADMMFLNNKNITWAFFELLDAHIFSLPYQGERLTMLIYLPRSRTGLSKMAENGPSKMITSQTLIKLKTDGSIVNVHLPKFKIESEWKMKEPLTKLGLKKMFSSEADFSGMLKSKEQLFCSDVIQKAFVEVSEEGTEAAAATGAVMMFRSIPRYTNFKVDHPFYFQIVDQFTNIVLFAGSCSNPTL